MRNKSYFYLDMQQHFLTVPYTNKQRRIRVLLPKDYHSDTEQTYPVVYMHDGQNVFHSREAYSGHSWKVIPTLKRNPDIPKMIIVAIDNDEDNRMNEYAPWKLKNTPLSANSHLGGKGIEYAEFVMDVVKPFIDHTYRTKADRDHTAMIGSSLGATISQFIGVQYQERIGQLGIFSSANWLNEDEFDRFIKRHTLTNQRVFIQVGTHEGDEVDARLTFQNVRQAYIDTALQYYRQLLHAGMPLEDIALIVAAGATHSEAAWANYLPDCLRFLAEKW